jgi:hypothetical protein
MMPMPNTMILEIQAMFGRIIVGRVPVTQNGEKRGVIHEF